MLNKASKKTKVEYLTFADFFMSVIHRAETSDKQKTPSNSIHSDYMPEKELLRAIYGKYAPNFTISKPVINARGAKYGK